MRIAALVVGLAVASPVVGQPPPPDAAPPADGTRETMAAFAAGIRALQPYTVSDDAFSSEKNDETIRTWLQSLEEQSKKLGHAERAKNVAFGVSAKVLEDQFTRALEAFGKHRKDDARWMVLGAQRACIQCHAQVPSASGQPLLEVPTVGIDPMARAELLFASRQFDAALEAYRKVVNNLQWLPIAPTSLQRMDYERAIDRLILLQVRVRRDFTGAAKDLEKVRAQKGVPRTIVVRADSWQRALESKSLQPPFDPAKADAKTILAWAKPRCVVPETSDGWDVTKTVPQLMTSGVVYALLQRLPPVPEFAQALLVAARCEAALGRSVDAPLTDLYLEECVRRAPHTTAAGECLKDLEGSLTKGGTATPLRSEQRKLDELKELAKE